MSYAIGNAYTTGAEPTDPRVVSFTPAPRRITAGTTAHLSLILGGGVSFYGARVVCRVP